jgi:hypothetical protein
MSQDDDGTKELVSELVKGVYDHIDSWLAMYVKPEYREQVKQHALKIISDRFRLSKFRK